MENKKGTVWFGILRRGLAALAAAVLLIGAAPASLAEESRGGGELTWTLADGVLTVEGNGGMDDYSEENPPPWHDSREQIVSVVIGGEVTSVGDYAFAGCANLALLTVGSGVETIGERAFEGCGALLALKLPSALVSLGKRAFAGCTSLVSVSVPSSVTTMGLAVFADCTRLMQASIAARIAVLPGETFAGCTSLVSAALSKKITAVGRNAFAGCVRLAEVYYTGAQWHRSVIAGGIRRDVPGFPEAALLSEDEKPESVFATQTQQQGEEALVIEESVTATSSATVYVRVERAQEGTATAKYTAAVTAVMEDAAGWSDAREPLEWLSQRLEEEQAAGAAASPAVLTVYCKGAPQVSAEYLQPLAGKAARLILHTQEGTIWAVDCSRLTTESLKDNLNLSLSVSPNVALTEKQQAVIGDAESYRLQFDGDVSLPAVVAVPIDPSQAGQVVTLYQKTVGREMERVQSAVLDEEGVAYFHLGAVDGVTSYLAAVNVAGEEKEDAIAPGGLSGNAEGSGVEYAMTGFRAAWGVRYQMAFWLWVVLMAAVALIGERTAAFLRRRRREKRNAASGGK
ncbi:MAG TPA: leucine-rich repeat domain-containing protein [Firmicutes bacterium]|nr:leucine-rich repeat domain-containing protein [Bacillota bacterium]